MVVGYCSLDKWSAANSLFVPMAWASCNCEDDWLIEWHEGKPRIGFYADEDMILFILGMM